MKSKFKKQKKISDFDSTQDVRIRSAEIQRIWQVAIGWRLWAVYGMQGTDESLVEFLQVK